MTDGAHITTIDPSQLRQEDVRTAAILIWHVALERLGEAVAARIQRAASRLWWSITRTEDVWRQEARRIEAWEMEAFCADIVSPALEMNGDHAARRDTRPRV